MIRKGSHKSEEYFGTQHRFEHWYVDNMVYFITSRCRHGTHAFLSQSCKEIFWDRFDHYTKKYEFVPFVTSLLSNHYHILGYLKIGANLAPMMRGFHGSVAKLVNDRLSERLVPFWVDAGHRNYFDGCIRDELQCRRAYRYVLTQSRRHGVCKDSSAHPGTRADIDVERAVKRSIKLKAFLIGVPYKRYAKAKV